MTAEDVTKAVAVIVEYMKQEQRRTQQSSSTVKKDGLGDYPHQDLAADICREILDASGRDGWGGCELCRS